MMCHVFLKRSGLIRYKLQAAPAEDDALVQDLSRACIRLALAFYCSEQHSKAVSLYLTLLSQQPTAPVLWFAMSKSPLLSSGGQEHR
eukprot:1694652-Rhodomonas_salina.1